MTDRAVLLSGGVESSVVLAMIAGTADRSSIFCINVDYEQANANGELVASKTLAKHYNATFVPVQVKGAYNKTLAMIRHRASPSATWKDFEVPYRNGMLLSIGAAWCQANNVPELYTGIQPPRAGGSAYADTTKEFLVTQFSAIDEGTHGLVSLRSPLIGVASKVDNIKEGERLGLPWYKTVSCFRSIPPCERCVACIRRKAAFEEAGVVDTSLGARTKVFK